MKDPKHLPYLLLHSTVCSATLLVVVFAVFSNVFLDAISKSSDRVFVHAEVPDTKDGEPYEAFDDVLKVRLDPNMSSLIDLIDACSIQFSTDYSLMSLNHSDIFTPPPERA